MDKYGKVWRLQEYCNRCGGSWSCTGVQCLMEQFPSEAQCFGRVKAAQGAPMPLYFRWRYSGGKPPR